MEEDMYDELKNISPDFPAKKSADVPDGYFTNFPDQVLNRWRQEESQHVVRKITLWRVISIAAIFSGLLWGGWWLFTTSAKTPAREISAVEAYQYIHENIDEFEPILEEANVSIDESQIDVPQEAVEEYLMEEIHGSDPEDLF